MDKEEGKKMAKNLKKEAEEKLNKVEDKVEGGSVLKSV